MKNKIPSKFIYKLILILPIFLSACTYPTLSKNECINANWNLIGYTDGKNGKDFDYLRYHNNACSELGILANQNEWEKGRQRGLNEIYCTPQNAYQKGLENKTLKNICPAHITPHLIHAQSKAKQIYNIKQVINSNQREYNNTLNEIKILQSAKNLKLSEIEIRMRLVQLGQNLESLKYKIQQDNQYLQHLQAQGF